MAGSDARTVEQIRRDIEVEREQLAGAADSLRESIGEATNVGAKLRANLPVAAAGAPCVGVLLAGGGGGPARLGFRRGRAGETKGRARRPPPVYRDSGRGPA